MGAGSSTPTGAQGPAGAQAPPLTQTTNAVPMMTTPMKPRNRGNVAATPGANAYGTPVRETTPASGGRRKTARKGKASRKGRKGRKGRKAGKGHK